jgi:hypothetical protein
VYVLLELFILKYSSKKIFFNNVFRLLKQYRIPYVKVQVYDSSSLEIFRVLSSQGKMERKKKQACT